MDPKEPLDRLGGYRVLRRIATGGTSDVLLAKAEGPLGFERQVVLKLLLSQYRDDPQFARMFAREAAAYARLSHPAIVRLFDFFSQNEQLVMVLEFVDGMPLNRLRATLKDAGKKLSDLASLYVADRVFDALASAHGYVDAQGQKSPVIHRDVNPSNVLVGWNSEVKLADFGIARVTGVRSDTQAGLIKGTFGYMAPEQVAGGDIGPHTDVYAAGVLLWEMLAHRKAIQRGALPEIEILRAMAEPKIVSLDILRPDLDPRLRAAVAAMIEPAPEKRTITAEEVCRTLRDVVQPGAGRGELHELLNVAKEREKAKKKPSGHEPVAEPVASPAPPAAKAPSVPPKAPEVRAKALDHVPAMLRTEPPPKPTEGDTDADATNELDVDKLFDGLALPDESSPLLEILESGPSTVPDDKSTAPTSPPPKAASTKPPPPLPAAAKAPTTQPLAATLASEPTQGKTGPMPAKESPRSGSGTAPLLPRPPTPGQPIAPAKATTTLANAAASPPPVPKAAQGALPGPAGAPKPVTAAELATEKARAESSEASFDDTTVARGSARADVVPLPSAKATLMMGSPEAAPLVPQDEKTGLVDGAKVTTAIMAERPPQLGPQAPPAPPMPPAAPVGLSGGAPPPPPPPPMVSPLMASAAPLVALDPRLVPPVPPPRPSIVGRVVALVFVALLSAGGGVAYVKRARWLPALGIGVAPEPQGTASSPPASASVPPPVEPPIAFGSSTPPVASAPEAGTASDASARDAAALPKDASAEVTKDAESPAPAPSASSASALVAKASTTILSTRSASPNHRIFFDGRVVGETPASVEVPCGKHTVQLGSAGTSRTLELPCGQELVVGDR